MALTFTSKQLQWFYCLLNKAMCLQTKMSFDFSVKQCKSSVFLKVFMWKKSSMLICIWPFSYPVVCIAPLFSIMVAFMTLQDQLFYQVSCRFSQMMKQSLCFTKPWRFKPTNAPLNICWFLLTIGYTATAERILGCKHFHYRHCSYCAKQLNKWSWHLISLEFCSRLLTKKFSIT